MQTRLISEGVDQLNYLKHTIEKEAVCYRGNKILLYFQQYLDALEKLEVLGNTYLKILED